MSWCTLMLICILNKNNYFYLDSSPKLCYNTHPYRKYSSSFKLKNSSLFKRRASSLNEKIKKFHVKDIFKCSKEKKYDKKIDDFFLNKNTTSRDRAEPSAFKIYPQVYPVSACSIKNFIHVY